MALGRISGQLLTSTLERDGIDLTITNNNDSILHFDMQNNRVGIKETNPTTELDVNGTLSSTAITTNTITASIGNLTLSPATGTDKIVLNGNVDISGSLTASLTLEDVNNIDFTQAGTSGLVLTSDGDSTYSFQTLTIPGGLTNSDTSPIDPNDGDMWLDTTSGKTYVYVVDADSGQWIQPSLTPIPVTNLSELSTLENNVNIDFTQAGTSGTVLTSDGDGSYSFQVPAETVKEAVQLINITSPIFDLDVADRQIFYQIVASGANWTLNIRGDSNTTLDSYLEVGESITVVYMATQGVTAYFNNAVSIDSVTITPQWSFGNSPTAGTPNAIDVYSYTITKTADGGTYTVLGNVSLYQ